MSVSLIRTHSNPRRIRLRPLLFWAIVVLLLVIHYALAATAIRGKSIVFDEPAHITPGVSFWMTNDYRLNPSSGYLPMRVEGLAVWATASKLPPLKGELWDKSLTWAVSRDWYLLLGDRYLETLYAGRLAAGIFSALLGLAVACWSRALFGDIGALVSLTLYAFCPTMLANGVLMTSDMAASLFFLLGLWAIWQVLHKATLPRIALAGVVLAGLALSKFSAALIVPVAAILVAIRVLQGRPILVGWGSNKSILLIRGRWRILGTALVAAVLSGSVMYITIWAAYGFRYGVQSPAQSPITTYERFWAILPSVDSPFIRVVLWVDHWRLLPQTFCMYLGANIYSTQGRNAFLNGEYSLFGWPMFFPFSFLVKTPLTTLGVLIMAVLAWGGYVLKKGKGRPRDPSLLWIYRTAPLWVFMGVYVVFAVMSKLNIGHRHLLAIYAPLYILGGAAGWWLSKPRQWQGVLAATLLGLLVIETLLTWPNYIAYFNQTIGGSRNGYKHLVDSSLDWGQDLPALRTWLEQQGINPPAELIDVAKSSQKPPVPVYLSYFGSVEPSTYDLHARYLHSYFDFYRPQGVPQPLTGGVYCVSATMVQNLYSQFPGHWNSDYELAYKQLIRVVAEFVNAPPGSTERQELERTRGAKYWSEAFSKFDDIRFGRLAAYLRQREPDCMINSSILVYRLTDQEVHDALEGPPVELDDSNVTE